MLIHVCPFLGLIARGVEGNVVCSTAGSLGSRWVHLDLVDVVVERAKVHVESSVSLDEVGVNGIVELATVRRNADRSVIGPGVELHGGRCGEADGRGPGAEGGDSIEYVVGLFDVMNIGCLC